MGRERERDDGCGTFYCVCVNVFKLNRFVTVDKNLFSPAHSTLLSLPRSLTNPINCKWSSIKPSLFLMQFHPLFACLCVHFDFQSTSVALYSSSLPISRLISYSLTLNFLHSQVPSNLFAIS